MSLDACILLIELLLGLVCEIMPGGVPRLEGENAIRRQVPPHGREQRFLILAPQKGLEGIAESAQGLSEEEVEEFKAGKVAQLYTETISQLTPRIVVNGRPQYLKMERVVNWVRSLLLAGLRSAVLWDQLGGGRMELMFGRRKMLDQAQQLLHSS